MCHLCSSQVIPDPSNSTIRFKRDRVWQEFLSDSSKTIFLCRLAAVGSSTSITWERTASRRETGLLIPSVLTSDDLPIIICIGDIMRTSIVIACVLFVLSSAFPSEVKSPTDTAAELLALDAGWQEAVVKGEVDFINKRTAD